MEVRDEGRHLPSGHQGEARMKRLIPAGKQPMQRKMARITGRPLGFLPPAPDPFQNLPEAETNEAAINNEVAAVRSAISDRLKADAKRKALATGSDYYFVVCFENDEQATAFLKAAGYPKIADAVIDGTILADLLAIKLPKVTERESKLKTVHDKTLTRLVKR